MATPPLLIQTTYSELLQRCESAAFDDAFPEDGGFVSKEVKGRLYWYFQTQTQDGRKQRYVGPETAELLERIKHHREARNDEKERRALVSTLTRQFGLPAPMERIGDVVSALAKAGLFRLRGVLIGTVAYQTYAAILGEKLPRALLQTEDVDVAQFTSVSAAIGDKMPPIRDVLLEVDPSFRKVPHLSREGVTRYKARGGLMVDILTPNEGPDTDDPRHLPALQAEAQPLRFLDFLIYNPVSAVLLHGSGVMIAVPAPERFAVHKIILSQRRPSAIAKSDKDAMQAEALINALARKRPGDLADAWNEAYERGPKWRKFLLAGMLNLDPATRDLLLKAAGRPRRILATDLTFNTPILRYDSLRDSVVFHGAVPGGEVKCLVSRETLDDHFGTDRKSDDERVAAVSRNRSKIEAMLREKYLNWPVDEPGVVILATLDVEKLSKRL